MHHKIVQKIIDGTRKNIKTCLFKSDCAFSVVATKYWNEVPDDVRDIELPLDMLKKKIKTHYFKISYC